MLDELDRTLFVLAYSEIDRSEKKRVTGKSIWQKMHADLTHE
jgi:hypothetical protein